MSTKTPTLWEGERLTFERSLALTTESLSSYGPLYRQWAIAYSGGQRFDRRCHPGGFPHRIEGDPTSRKLDGPLRGHTHGTASLTGGSAGGVTNIAAARNPDTGGAASLGRPLFCLHVWARGASAEKSVSLVYPATEGRADGKSTGSAAYRAWREGADADRVRLGESAARDQRIALSCSKDGAECGQGWFQQKTPQPSRMC
jgi:DNA sulfur modification protein DndC